MRNQRTDFPVIACAVSCIDGEYRASIGARPSHAILLSGKTPSSAADFADFVAEHTPTGGNLRGSAAYRTHLIRVLTERCMTELGGM